jgi:hypothetical protein
MSCSVEVSDLAIDGFLLPVAFEEGLRIAGVLRPYPTTLLFASSLCGT